MAKELLVTESLSDAMLKAGEKLLNRLDSAMADVKSAFWLYYAEEKAWKFIVASPKVDSEGPRNYYKKIDSANASAAEDEEILSLHDIVAVNTSMPIVKLLKIAVNTGDKPSKGIRFSRNAIKGTFIEDCYIYRST